MATSRSCPVQLLLIHLTRKTFVRIKHVAAPHRCPMYLFIAHTSKTALSIITMTLSRRCHLEILIHCTSMANLFPTSLKILLIWITLKTQAVWTKVFYYRWTTNNSTYKIIRQQGNLTQHPTISVPILFNMRIIRACHSYLLIPSLLAHETIEPTPRRTLSSWTAHLKGSMGPCSLLQSIIAPIRYSTTLHRPLNIHSRPLQQ